MASPPASPLEADPAAVELLGGASGGAEGDGGQGGRHRDRLPALVLTVALLGIGLLVLLAGPRPVEPAPGRAVGLAFHFDDPFEVDWRDLPAADEATAASGPQPMVGDDARCIGFARSDWPEARRHPSVAHCLDLDRLGRLGPDTVGVHRIVAGRDTWYYLFFASTVTDVRVDVGDGQQPPATGGSNSMVGPVPVHRGDRVTAVLVPTSAPGLTVEWQRPAGDRYRATIT